MSDLTPPRSERVDLRMTPDTKSLLQRAAADAHKSMTEFLLDSALRAAAEAAADKRVFEVDEDQWRAFQAALDTPPKDNSGLRDLLSRKPVWEA